MKQASDNQQASPDLKSLLPATPFSPPQGQFRLKFVEMLASEDDFLPSDTSVLGKLWNLLHSDESSIEDCGNVIKLDAALTARVFRLANSPTYRGNAKTLPEALLHLGLITVRQIVFSTQILQRFSQLHPPAGWDYFWLRNLLVGQITERLAAVYFRPTGAEYLSGLLHDTGWLLLANTFPAEFNALFATPKPLQEAEQEIFSFTHAEISAAICAKSYLPERVTNAVLNHHRPDLVQGKFDPRDSALFLSNLLFLADRIADSRGMILRPGDPAPTIEEIAASPQALWLAGFGKTPNFAAISDAEMGKVEAFGSSFFPPKK